MNSLKNEGGINMKKVLLRAFIIFSLLLFVSPFAVVESRAQDQEIENKGLLKFLSSINMGFNVDVMYEYNFNDPDSGINSFRSLDEENNEFEIQEASIYFEKVPELGDTLADYIGFKIWVLLGENAGKVAASGLSDDTIDLTEAYINVLAPVGNGLSIYAGKFTTIAGFELIQAKDNPNITRGFLFGLAEPFTHTGLRFSYPAGPLSFTFGINNGWDLVDDNNDGKTFETQIAYGGDIGSFSVTGYFGPEQDGSDGDFDGDWREFITVFGSVNPVDWLTLSAYADFGWEQGVSDASLGLDEDDVFWWGVAGFIVADVHPAVSLRLRGEWFDDDDGFRTGIPGGAQLFNITPTVAFKPFKGKIFDLEYMDNFEFRIEYRFDWSDEDAFEDSDGSFDNTQNTIALQALYWFDL